MSSATMIKMVASGAAVDVSLFPVTPEGWFRLEDHNPDLLYCSIEKNDWIWSIGKNIETGEIFGSFQMDFYSREGFESIWLWPVRKIKM